MKNQGFLEIFIIGTLMVIVLIFIIFFMSSNIKMSGNIVHIKDNWKIGNAEIETEIYLENITDNQIKEITHTNFKKSIIYSIGAVIVVLIIAIFRHLNTRLKYKNQNRNSTKVKKISCNSN